jgi:hypothetical protein
MQDWGIVIEQELEHYHDQEEFGPTVKPFITHTPLILLDDQRLRCGTVGDDNLKISNILEAIGRKKYTMEGTLN